MGAIAPPAEFPRIANALFGLLLTCAYGLGVNALNTKLTRTISRVRGVGNQAAIHFSIMRAILLYMEISRNTLYMPLAADAHGLSLNACVPRIDRRGTCF